MRLYVETLVFLFDRLSVIFWRVDIYTSVMLKFWGKHKIYSFKSRTNCICFIIDIRLDIFMSMMKHM